MRCACDSSWVSTCPPPWWAISSASSSGSAGRQVGALRARAHSVEPARQPPHHHQIHRRVARSPLGRTPIRSGCPAARSAHSRERSANSASSPTRTRRGSSGAASTPPGWLSWPPPPTALLQPSASPPKPAPTRRTSPWPASRIASIPSRCNAAIAALPSLDFGAFEARCFFLYRSQLHPTGSVYTKLSEFPLNP